MSRTVAPETVRLLHFVLTVLKRCPTPVRASDVRKVLNLMTTNENTQDLIAEAMRTAGLVAIWGGERRSTIYRLTEHGLALLASYSIHHEPLDNSKVEEAVQLIL